MHIVLADMEGVFTPEIWINVAEKTGVSELRLTTRDISDYDVLMTRRLEILRTHGLKLDDITRVIATMEPLPGATEFLDRLRRSGPVIIVSDTFEQFAGPLIRRLGWPTLFCHTLEVAPDGTVTGYQLRLDDGKRRTVDALQGLNYRVIAVGDSYNDIRMLQAAEAGILFKPPENVRAEFPDLPATNDYEALYTEIRRAVGGS